MSEFARQNSAAMYSVKELLVSIFGSFRIHRTQTKLKDSTWFVYNNRVPDVIVVCFDSPTMDVVDEEVLRQYAAHGMVLFFHISFLVRSIDG